jgi:hypothetical protein
MIMDFDTLLEKMEANRPDLADSFALMRQFQKAKEDDNGNEEPVTQPGRFAELERQFEKQKRINSNLFKQYEKLETNYRLLIMQLDEMAEATGACPHCWGEADNCTYCRGKGRPGYFQPKEEYFDIYIKPVINKLKTSPLNH